MLPYAEALRAQAFTQHANLLHPVPLVRDSAYYACPKLSIPHVGRVLFKTFCPRSTPQIITKIRNLSCRSAHRFRKSYL